MANGSISVEGGLFPADLLERIATGDEQGQSAKDFRIEGGASERLTAAMQAAFSGIRLHWASYRRSMENSSGDAGATTRITRQRWIANLVEELGYEELQRQASALEAGERRYRIYATAGKAPDAPPVHVVGSYQDLDRRSTNNRRSPHALLQDYLNNSDALWGIVTNGDRLRLLRDSTLFTRPTYIEFDIRGIVEGNQYADFARMYRLLHRTRLPADSEPPNDCLLERYYQDGLESHSRVRDRLRDGVEQALLLLGNGFLQHPKSDDLRERIASDDGPPALSAEDYYRQLLRLVYRLLFLMVAEERGMLAGSSEEERRLYGIYERYYSVAQLRSRAEGQPEDNNHYDLWEGLKQTFLIFRTDENARIFGMQALDGELFSDAACADLETAYLDNRILLRAMLRLSTFWDEGKTDARSGRRRSSRGVRRRVNYAGIDVEEFGSVYESLLDYQPQFTNDPLPGFEFIKGTERKQTGSYYTPPELVKELIESALLPVMRERIANAKSDEDKVNALLSLKVCDPAAGSGHFLLAAARKIATEVARLRSGEVEPTPQAYREAMRETIQSCIYGVDKNPLAVDLCKVALWIEGHASGKPLSFLDHRIRCGDSLVGVLNEDALLDGISNDAYKAVAGDDKPTASAYRKRNREDIRRQGVQLQLGGDDTDDLANEFIKFAGLAEDTARDIQRKRDRFDSLRGLGTDWWQKKVACDIWTAAFFMRKHPDEPPVPTTADLRRHMLTNSADGLLIGNAVQIAERRGFFHWYIEFPEVFDNGGFDIVLGNPPWEVIQAEEKSFFSQYDSHIASLAGQNRKRAIAELPLLNPGLAVIWDKHCQDIESTTNFTRGCGRLSLTAKGKINNYAVFAETARKLLAPNGRMGMIMPTGIATDNSTKDFFADIAQRGALISLFDFENRQKVFPGIDSRIKFCLFTIGGEGQRNTAAEFAFYLHRTEQLRDDNRRFHMDADDFALFSPNTGNCPIFRSRRDMEINRKMYERAGVLWQEAKFGRKEVNPWGVGLMQMFNMTTASHLFRTREQLEDDGWTLAGNIFERGGERYLPLYEAKLFHQYDHRFATFGGVSDARVQKGNARDVSADEKQDASTVILPRYWIAEKEVQNRLDKSRMANIIDPTRPDPTRPDPTRPDPTRPDRRSDPSHRQSYGQANYYQRGPSGIRTGAQGSNHPRPDWNLALRLITNATNRRTIIISVIPDYGMGHKGAVLSVCAGLSPSERQHVPQTHGHASQPSCRGQV